MVNSNNLHLVKAELINLNDLIEEYKEASHAYCRELTSNEVKPRTESTLIMKRNSMISWHTYIQYTLGYHKPRFN